MNKPIGIIGGGFVGQILKQYYPEAKVWDIDIAKSTASREEVLSQDYIFVAVNFQDNCSSNDSKDKLYQYFTEANNQKGEKFIIIKSTFVPGTLDYFQSEFPYLKFAYNPEFLTERTAWDDFTNPQFQILGLPHQTLPYYKELFEILPPAKVYRVISPLDAEILKHAFNSYYATKVIFFNQLYDACLKLGGDYETMREIMVQNPWIGDSHSHIMHKGYRGFGGKCLPKDTQAFQLVGESELLKKVIELNANLQSK